MSNEPNTPTSVDLTDLVEVMCDYRREKFPFERSIAAMTLCGWLHYPLQPAVIEWGRLLAAANVIRSLKGSLNEPAKSRRTINEVFNATITPDFISRALFAHEIPGFENWVVNSPEDIGTAESVSNFLLSCPANLKPSLNKAFFFCDEGGYGIGAVSISTAKKAWARFAAITPFASARFFLQYERIRWNDDGPWSVDFFHLPPDGQKSVDHARSLMNRTDDIRKYFSACRFVQERIIEILGSNFVSAFPFPTEVKPEMVTFQSLEPKQIEIVKRYRAPTLI